MLVAMEWEFIALTAESQLIHNKYTTLVLWQAAALITWQYAREQIQNTGKKRATEEKYQDHYRQLKKEKVNG